MGISRVFAGCAAVALLAACGAEGASGDAPAVADVESAAEVVPAVADAPAEAVVSDVAIPEAAPADIAAPEAQELEQPAIWPAANVVFATPEEAAADFVESVLIGEGDAELGEFQAGDARSGEIDVLSPGESEGTEATHRGALLLRQLGPDNGWFVITANSMGATIATPTAGSEVAAGSLTIEGEARGFEGTVIVSAFPPGDVDAQLDSVIARGGALADLEPYSATLDLSSASPGDVVVILVHGDTGLGTDPSWFAAVPVVVADDVVVGTIPETR